MPHAFAMDAGIRKSVPAVRPEPGVVFGKNHWRLHADDDALMERLDHTGVITRIEAMENLPVIRFSAARKTLSYIEDILPNLAPLPERFQKQLEQLAQINEQVNSAPSPSLT